MGATRPLKEATESDGKGPVHESRSLLSSAFFADWPGADRQRLGFRVYRV